MGSPHAQFVTRGGTEGDPIEVAAWRGPRCTLEASQPECEGPTSYIGLKDSDYVATILQG